MLISEIDNTKKMTSSPCIVAYHACSPAALDACQQLVASQYRRLSSSRLQTGEVFQEFYPQGAVESSEVIATFAVDVERHPMGTMRLNHLSQIRTPTSEVGKLGLYDLMDSDRPWGEVFRSPLNKIAEIARFAMTEDLTRGPLQVKLNAFKNLFDLTYNTARNLGYEQICAVMPRHVTRLLDQCGVGYDEAPGVSLALNNEFAARVFRKYDLYWQPDNPRREPKLFIFR